MIIDVRKFVEHRESAWVKLAEELDQYEESKGKGWDLDRVENLYDLYHQSCSDLAQAQSFSSDPQLVRHLEILVSRAYGTIYRRRRVFRWKTAVEWTYKGFPQSFRKNIRYFWLSLAITLVGALLGGFLVANDPEAKRTVFGDFTHLLGDPSERVAQEESIEDGETPAVQAQFSSQLMTHNIRVSLFALSLGLLWGTGTIIVLFYNGAILGGVCYDYIQAGEGEFLAGWLLPHGVIEIPAILIAGQVGLMIAQCLLGWNSDLSIADRFKSIRGELARLIGGIFLMLVWAGFVESYLSQTHEPQISYSSKIMFGIAEFIVFFGFLALSGRNSPKQRGTAR